MSGPRLLLDEDRSLISGEMLNAAVHMSQAEYDQWWMERVKARCVVTERGCWVWQGNQAINGYGLTSYRSKTRIVHRKMFEVANGVTLGRWEYACHSCDVRLCCNPAHLWKGTPLDNQVDSVMKRRNGEQQVTHCPREHEYNEENTTWKVAASGRPARECKACVRQRNHDRYHRNIQESRAKRRAYRAAKRVARQQEQSV